jgi:hypothetical protein
MGHEERPDLTVAAAASPQKAATVGRRPWLCHRPGPAVEVPIRRYGNWDSLGVAREARNETSAPSISTSGSDGFCPPDFILPQGPKPTRRGRSCWLCRMGLAGHRMRSDAFSPRACVRRSVKLSSSKTQLVLPARSASVAWRARRLMATRLSWAAGLPTFSMVPCLSSNRTCKRISSLSRRFRTNLS